MILTCFIGIAAVFGSSCMFIRPDGSLLGLKEMLPYFRVLPFSDLLFQDYTFSGLMLLLVNGLPNLDAFLLLLRRKRSGHVLTAVQGILLMAWISIQFAIFPMNALDIIFFLYGALQFIIGYISLVSYIQENTAFDPRKYKDIQEDSDTVVIYFSRKGYTRKIAYRIADKTKASIQSLKTKERTEGDIGFFWCGRFAMHRWPMETENIPLDERIRKVILVTPIWVFRMSSPMRDFILRNQEYLKKRETVIYFNHFNPWLPGCAVKEVKERLPRIQCESYCTMLGHTFYPGREKN